uniref:C-type lectin domain-containing protein n=1 Tax=Daphnia galeata TaxID=27404 RepID=A0A8J2S6C5_9CRUS|nr:unnamed protein product [Daphnia galeata]
MAASIFTSTIITFMVFNIIISMTPVTGSPTGYVVCPQYLTHSYGANTLIPCWLLDNGHCYCFSLYTECWSNANYMCAQGGMSLVAFETGDEDNMIKRHLINIPELKGYAYWTSGKYNESATEWQWFSNKKPLVFGDLLSNTEQVKDKEDVLNKCLLSNYIEEDYLSGGFASRYCASFGYRFTCEATLMSQS